MILDAGICTVYQAVNGADAGSKPIDTLVQKYKSWFGELEFSSDAVYVTDYREDVETSARIRILQNKTITNRDVAVLSTMPSVRFEITRIYHGIDDDNGQLISDISLRRIN